MYAGSSVRHRYGMNNRGMAKKIIWTLWEKAIPEQRATITEHAEIVIRHSPSPAKPG